MDGIRRGDVVSFSYVSGSKDAENIEKVTPTPRCSCASR
jgi:hypothetical protein